MNRYKWLAQYVLRMRNIEFPVFTSRRYYRTICGIPRLTIIKDCDWLGDDYYLRIATSPKINNILPMEKTFRISEKDYNTIIEGFK